MGDFELGKTSHMFNKFITVVSTTLLYRMYDMRFILFFLPPALISGRVRIQKIIINSYIFVALNTVFKNYCTWIGR